MKEVLGIIAAALVVVAYAAYFRDILRGTTKPHPVSWFIWGINSTLIYLLQVSHGSGAGAYSTLAVAIVSFGICVLASRDGLGVVRGSDLLVLALALLAACSWFLAEDSVSAMLLLVSADVLGIIPSIRKAWRTPREETVSMWLLSTLRQAMSIVALSNFGVVSLLNPVVWLILNACMSALLIARRSTAL